MPMAILAVAATAIGSAVGGAIASGILATVIGAVVTMGINMLGSAIFDSGPSGGGGGDSKNSFDQQQSDATQMTRQPITTRKIIYGTRRVSGPLIYLESGGGAGDNKPNIFLHVIIPFATHKCDAITDVYFDDNLVWTSAGGGTYQPTPSNDGTLWSAVARIKPLLGDDNQLADPDLLAANTSWTAAHRLRGITALYCMLTYTQDIYSNGVPNISAVVRGKPVLDPRTATTGYSANPALCIQDYILTPKVRGGYGDISANIDTASFNALANLCDEDVALKEGGTEKRYELHGVFDTANKPGDIIQNMLTSFGGRIVNPGRRWYVYGAAYRTPIITLDETILRAPLRLLTKTSIRDKFNAVKGTFASKPDNDIVTDYPSIASAQYALDDGEVIYKDYPLPFTRSPSMAQRLAKVFLLQSRLQNTLVLPCKIGAYRLKVGDTFKFNFALFGWVEKVFEITNSDLSVDNKGELGVDLSIRETDPSAYDWNTSEEKDYTNATATNLPNPFLINSPNLTTLDELRTFGTSIATVLIADLATDNAFATNFEVQARRAGDSIWVNMGRASGTRYELQNVVDGQTYELRARVILTIGASSPWSNIVTHTVIGKTAKPINPTGFMINIIGDTIHATWDPDPELDWDGCIMRYSPLTLGATWPNSIEIEQKIGRTTSVMFPARTGTYFLKYVDVLGNESTTPAQITTIIEEIENFNLVHYVPQEPTFPGTKTNLVATDNILMLDTETLFDDGAGNFDDGVGLFDSGTGSFYESGEYIWSGPDLGAVYTSRYTAIVEFFREDNSVLFDDNNSNFDDTHGLFDGSPESYSDCNVEIYIRVTNDDPLASPVYSSWRRFTVTDLSARHAQYKAVPTTKSPFATPKITKLGVICDMPDREFTLQDQASGAAPYTINYDPPFKFVKAVGITLQNGQRGDYFKVTGKTASSCVVTFYDLSDTIVDRTFDAKVRGYGKNFL